MFQGMFCVESAVRQLKPDFIVHHVLEAEERQWSKVHLGLDTDDCGVYTATTSSAHTSSSSDSHDPGLVLLRWAAVCVVSHVFVRHLCVLCVLYTWVCVCVFVVVAAKHIIVGHLFSKPSNTIHAF